MVRPHFSERGEDLSRRTLLERGAGAFGAGAFGAAAFALAGKQAAGAPLAQGFIDAHSHIWTPDLARYPLAKGFTREQMQPASFTADELLSEARPCGVTRVVLIQMSYYRFDNAYMLAAMRDYPKVFSGVAVIDEHAANVGDTMRALKKQGVRGFRIHPGTQAVDAWLSSPGMATMWKLGADERLAMCALVNPEALGPLDRMCEKFPDTPVVIDHFGRIGTDGTIRDENVEKLCRLARHAQTYVKVSAYYALGKKQAPYTDLGPMIGRLVEAFGARRLMWASDCPFQVQNGHTYRDSIDLVRTRLDFLSPADRQWLLGKTAEQVFFS